MARRRIIAGNWKMNMTPSQAVELINTLKPLVANDEVDVLLCVPAIDIIPAMEAAKGSNIMIGAENMYFEEKGAYTGEISPNMLTDAEYAIWLMIEFVKERESNQQPRPSEVTKTVYEDLLKRFSNESKVPVEDLRTLWKELPQKNTVKLHPQQLSVDKIINYNVQVNQASDVEELYNKKMAEQP